MRFAVILAGVAVAAAILSSAVTFVILDSVEEGCVECSTQSTESQQAKEKENSGLLGGSEGASLAVVMLLGVAAATLVAGARTATRR